MQEMYDLLVNNDIDVLDMIRAFVAKQPFQFICQRLLHHLDDATLLDFLSGILGQSYSHRQLQKPVSRDSHHLDASSGGTAAQLTSQLEQWLQLIIFGCITWHDLESFSLHVALAFRFQQVHRSWQQSGRLQVLLHTSKDSAYGQRGCMLASYLRQAECDACLQACLICPPHMQLEACGKSPS